MGFGFDDVGKIVGEAAPLVGGLLGGPAGSAVGGMVASALGVENDPEKIKKAVENDPEAAVKLRQLEQEHQRELRSMTLEAETTRLAEVNKTYRTELASKDGYTRRMRPTFGYIVAASILAEAAALVWAIVADPAKMEMAIQFVRAMSIPQSIALTVLGVYVKKRSDEKEVDRTGLPKQGLLSKIL